MKPSIAEPSRAPNCNPTKRVIFLALQMAQSITTSNHILEISFTSFEDTKIIARRRNG
jgi:hypothetical protein